MRKRKWTDFLEVLEKAAKRRGMKVHIIPQIPCDCTIKDHAKGCTYSREGRERDLLGARNIFEQAKAKDEADREQ